ncbi:MAG: VanW family protein [Clostridia bacterium]|nr:VanW family protein [Clostridia bacterium]
MYHNKFDKAYNPICLNVSNSNMQVDDTIFNLYYENKVWTFYAKDFEINSNVFSIDARINNWGRNGSRQDKIKLINKLVKINIDPEIAFNYIYFGFNNKLNKIQKNIEKLPKDAEIRIKNNKINIKNEIIGIKLDKYLFYNNLIKLYQNNKIINLNIPVIKSKPNITREGLEKYTHKRSEFSTSIATSSSGRKYNIRKALNAINGTHLNKTEKFSFNNCVGKRTADKGYKNAKVILDGEFVEGVGGGVCQVSSTLYNAVLLAGLNVTSSQKHSQRVGYVKAGFDAMVNYGSSDLIFENNTEGDIYILCKYTDSSITISIYGADLKNVSYNRQYEIVNPITAGETQIIYDNDGKYIDKVLYNDECFELKSARDGYTIKSYLIKLVDGVEVDKRLLRTDKYLPQHSVIVYGVKQRETHNIFDIFSSNVN